MVRNIKKEIDSVSTPVAIKKIMGFDQLTFKELLKKVNKDLDKNYLDPSILRRAVFLGYGHSKKTDELLDSMKRVLGI